MSLFRGRNRGRDVLGKGGQEEFPCKQTKFEATVSHSQGGAGPSGPKSGAEKGPAWRWTFGSVSGV